MAPEAPAIVLPAPLVTRPADFERRVLSYGGSVDFVFKDSESFRGAMKGSSAGRNLTRMLGSKTTLECRHATLAESKAGNLMCAYYAGAASPTSDGAIWLSRYTRGEWSPPERLPKVNDEPHGCPVLFRDPKRAIYLFFKVGANAATWRTYWMESEDGGRSWNQATELVPGDQGGRGPVRCKPILLADGAWLAPASTDRGDREQGAWKAFVDRSEDAGKTWTRSADFTVDPAVVPGAGTIQPSLWQSEPNHVHALMRTSGGFIGRCDSADNGVTWTPVVPSPLKNNNSPIDTLRLEDGRLLLVYNPARKDVGPKSPLNLAVSSDNGATWTDVAQLEADPGDFHQPSILRTKVGIAVAYAWNNERIRVWQIPLRALEPSKTPG